MGKRRESGTEVIERKTDALVLEARDNASRELEVGKQRAFGNFDNEPLGGKAGLGQRLDDTLSEPAIGKLEGRDVDGDLDLGIPARRLTQGFADHLLRQATNQADFFGN